MDTKKFLKNVGRNNLFLYCKNKSFLETIKALVDHIEKVEKEFVTIYQSIAEADTMIDHLTESKKAKYMDLDD